MPQATIVSKSGATITIEGTANEVAAILAKFEGASEVGRAVSLGGAGLRETRSDPVGPSSLILDLKAARFFDKPRTLGDIAGALEERGYMIPTTTLSGVVLSLLKRGQLHRRKIEGKWNYGK